MSSARGMPALTILSQHSGRGPTEASVHAAFSSSAFSHATLAESRIPARERGFAASDVEHRAAARARYRQRRHERWARAGA